MLGVHLLHCVEFRSRIRFGHRLLAHATAIGIAAGAISLLGSWVRPASAQDAQRVYISVAPLMHATPDSKAQLPIQIGPQGAIPQDSFIRIRGLPPFAALSDGYVVTAGSWSVPLPAARRLAIVVPAKAQGRSEIAIDVVRADGSVLAQAKTVLVVASTAAAADHSQHQRVETAAIGVLAALDPSPLAAIQQGFEAFFAKSAKTKGDTNALTAEQKAETFRQFLTWPQNPLRVDVNVRMTSAQGMGELVGTLTVGNTEIVVAGRKEAGLLLKPNLKGLSPGLYAFHVHENANCGSAVKDGEAVPGLAAGSHLWLSGTGQMSGTVFTSHLGNLPHLEVDADGTASKPIVAARLTLADVANRSLMIHASQDDYSPRLACGRLN
jgi:Cu-Zn family superoxide dismutase